MNRINKILAANRSEIAIRIFRAAEESGIKTVAIYSKEDRFALHRFKTDESYLVGEGKGPIQAYLDINSIIDIAKKAKKKIMIQINRANQRSKLIIKKNDYIKSLNVPSVNTIIGNRQIYASSMGEGKTAIEKQRKGNAVEEIKKLSEQILTELN